MSRRSDAGRGALEDLQAARLAPPPTMAGSPAAELERIRQRVRELRYDHNNPERFHAERSDIAGAIGGLLNRLGGDGEPRRGLPSLAPRRERSPDPRPVARVAGRSILTLRGAHDACD